MNTYTPITKREYLAHAVAQEFDDTEHLAHYLQSCKKYPLIFIHRAFSEAKSVPADRVRKSRAAIFFYLLKKYQHERNQNPGR